MKATDQAVGEEPQADERPRITVYVKPAGCQPCKATLRKLNELEIPHNKIIVHEHHLELIDELKREAKKLGVAGELPCINVYYPSTGDESTWFGYQPEKINDLKKELQS